MAETGAETLVTYDCADRIVTLTLNRPDRLNAFSDDLVRHLADALRRFDLDPQAEVAIICGAGRAFSSGADVHQRQLRRREEFLEHGGPQGWGANSADLLTRSVNWKPVIAAPHGYAMGLALGIVLECDLIVAAAGTRFQVTETSRGLGGSKYWALLNFRGGAAFASEVALTGRFFTAEEALAAGIVNRVAPAGRASRSRARARLRGREQPAALGARDGAHPALVHGAARARGGDADRALEALSLGGFSRGGARLCRKAPAGAVQGPLRRFANRGRGFAMITPAYVRTMAAYNAEMNRRLYGAAARLSEAERRAPRGAFWGSVHGTLTHILWGDRQWMSRFDDWEKPATPIKQSAQMIDDFAELAAARATADAGISRWAHKVDDAWLGEDLVWFSGAANREIRAPKRLLVTHFFNHQTHHRGQAHALLTAAGQETGDTDLFLLIPEIVA